MTNKDIARIFKKTAQLMELHEANAFKVRAMQNAVLNIEQQPTALCGRSEEDLQAMEGIGKGLARQIVEICETDALTALSELLEKTPEGIIELLDLKGIGPKKLRNLWIEHKIDNADALLEAAENGEIAKLKGFGAKTQENIKTALIYLIENRGKKRYADAESLADEFLVQLKSHWQGLQISPTGELRRKCEVISQLEYLIASDQPAKIMDYLTDHDDLEPVNEKSGPYTFYGIWIPHKLPVLIRICQPSQYFGNLVALTASPAHLPTLNKDGQHLFNIMHSKKWKNENEVYEAFDLSCPVPEIREWPENLESNNLIELSDIKGCMHNHSTYSDGKNSIEEMAQACKERNLEYFGLSDHSQSAYYASGLQPHQIEKQLDEIDEINKKLSPFKIFKGIESDILADGSLDYDDEILQKFDFIVSSIHSSLNMDVKKATTRLIRAIENPFTTMLGHMTGRLLLRREGYPVDHKAIIKACAQNDVIIEINANPWRLDIDWRWIRMALDEGVMLSINPDAHETDGIDHMKYGVITGRKGGLTKDRTFNCFDLKQAEEFLVSRKKKKGIN